MTTDITDPNYFHKVVDCQYACPAHTNVPEYIRMIAHGRYTDAYMLNRESNVFPGILGRTCDRPCEPACRRGRVEESNREKPEPVAIFRLKRVAFLDVALIALGFVLRVLAGGIATDVHVSGYMLACTALATPKTAAPATSATKIRLPLITELLSSPRRRPSPSASNGSLRTT